MKAPCHAGRAFARVIFMGAFPVNRKSGNVASAQRAAPGPAARSDRPRLKLKTEANPAKRTFQETVARQEALRRLFRSPGKAPSRTRNPAPGAQLRAYRGTTTVRFGCSVFTPSRRRSKIPARRVQSPAADRKCRAPADRRRSALSSRAIERVTPRDLDRLLGADTVHQGAMLETEPLPEPEWNDLAIARADGR